MLLVICLLIATILAAWIAKFRVPGGVNDAKLGWMSQQWLAEHRSSRS